MPEQPPTTEAEAPATGLTPRAMPVGGIAPIGSGSSLLRLDADVSSEIAELVPSFGDVLGSIGEGVAASQEALDAGLVESARQLSETKITVVSDVIQKLDDDGLPIADQTELISNDVSLINFVNPTVHEWKHVALSMDLNVGEVDNEQGFRFSQTQKKSGVATTGLFWGFLGWFDDYSETTTTTRSGRNHQEADWAQGQIRMDARLGPRATERFPIPARVEIGPQIFFSQGSTSEVLSDGVVSQRSMQLLIQVRKANGDVNPNVPIEVDASRFRIEFVTTDGFTGSTTNPDGEIKVILRRDIPNARFLRAGRTNVTARLGEVSKSIAITL